MNIKKKFSAFNDVLSSVGNNQGVKSGNVLSIYPPYLHESATLPIGESQTILPPVREDPSIIFLTKETEPTTGSVFFWLGGKGSNTSVNGSFRRFHAQTAWRYVNYRLRDQRARSLGNLSFTGASAPFPPRLWSSGATNGSFRRFHAQTAWRYVNCRLRDQRVRSLGNLSFTGASSPFLPRLWSSARQTDLFGAFTRKPLGDM